MTRRYEVRVEGELGEPMLRYLNWPHRLEPAYTRVRLDKVTAADLEVFLAACDRAGLTIERIQRV
jgi:hypothetical protein